MALGGAGALLLAQHVELRHLGENTPLASMTGVVPLEVCRASGSLVLGSAGASFNRKRRVPQLAASHLSQMPTTVQGGAFLLSPAIA